MSVCPSAIRDTPATNVLAGESIRVRGLVQGVGFRPTVWRVARDYGVSGEVCNDGEGVLIRAWGEARKLDAFVAGVRDACPPLARIDSLERRALDEAPPRTGGFRIVASAGGHGHTGVVPDAVTCRACLEETLDPSSRRYRYPFTNCTHCGPRLSIIGAIPYDRPNTTMAAFALCAACRAEYDDPADRRFHAQPIACPACGPRVWLERRDGTQVDDDALDAARRALLRGAIVAIKGLGGFQLACDATDEVAVARLRALKQRERKPFALLARDIAMIERYCVVGMPDDALLRSPAGPIVIMPVGDAAGLASSVAPDIATLGFMLPSTPLHHLLMQTLDRPIVLTSGNLADEPQCIDNAEAHTRLARIADYLLMHDRDIARRVDDTVARVMGGVPRLLRRARGYAPAPLRLPDGFADAPQVLAMGGELKNTFCLLRDGEAVLSHHIGDLENASTYCDYGQTLARYQQLFEHEPRLIALDQHPEYLSRKLGIEIARQRQVPFVEVQHHHAHLAACLAENDVRFDAARGDTPALGIVLDGLGFGADGTLWGGEFLLGGYTGCERVAAFRPVALPGGVRAIYEPWRNTYAHIGACLGWSRFDANYATLELQRYLSDQPRALLDGMIARGVNSPVASSAGRLFDAVAAATGVCRSRVQYEGQAAIELETLVDMPTLHDEDDALAYGFALVEATSAGGPLLVDPEPMWIALLDDLMRATPVPVIAARFHKGVALAIVRVVERLRAQTPRTSARQSNLFDTVALSGGVMQNRVLFEQLVPKLGALGLKVLTHRQVPPNDGGIALGQAAVAAARALTQQRSRSCA